MAIFTHSVLAPNEAVVAGTVVSYDLPVSPLSHCLVTLKFAQNVANTPLSFANVAAMIGKIEVLYKGSAVYSMNGIDAMACGIFINGFESWGVNAYGADNDLRSFTFLVPFGRRLYDPKECYPASTRGELILQVTYQAAFVEIDAVSAQIETVELPEASPAQFLRMTTLSVTPTAAGQLDVDLPIGNKLSDLVLFHTTIPCADVATTTIQEVEIRVNNDERYYSRSYFETLHNMAGRMRAAPGYWGYHTHDLGDAAFAQYMDTDPPDPCDHILKNHLHMPFDVLGDGTYILDAGGLSSFELRMQVGDTNAIRIIPVEIVAAS